MGGTLVPSGRRVIEEELCCEALEIDVEATDVHHPWRDHGWNVQAKGEGPWLSLGLVRSSSFRPSQFHHCSCPLTCGGLAEERHGVMAALVHDHEGVHLKDQHPNCH